MRSSQLLALLAITCLPAFALAQEAAQITPLPGLMLSDQNGQMHHDKDLRGKYTLVHLGYARCTKDCAAMLATMGEVMKQLGKDADKVQPVFISLDAADSDESLKAFMKPYDPRILALHGKQNDVDKLIENYQLYTATALNQQTGETKIMDHAPNLYFFDKGAQYVGDFAPEESAADIAGDIRMAIEQKEKKI